MVLTLLLKKSTNILQFLFKRYEHECFMISIGNHLERHRIPNIYNDGHTVILNTVQTTKCLICSKHKRETIETKRIMP